MQATARRPDRKVATILNGASVSNIIDLQGSALVALIMPDGWTAAAITFLTCDDNIAAEGDQPDSQNLVPVYDDEGAEVTISSGNVAASRCITIDANAGKLAALRFLQLRSGTAAAAVNQGAERQIVVVLKA